MQHGISQEHDLVTKQTRALLILGSCSCVTSQHNGSRHFFRTEIPAKTIQVGIL